MTQTEQLTEWITADKLTIRKPNAKILKQIDTKVLVEKLCHSIVRISLSQIPLTTEAGRLGKEVLDGLEDLTKDEGTINRARIEVGLQLLRILITNKIIRIYRLLEDKHQYVIAPLDEEFVNAIFWRIPVKPIQNHTQPSYSTPPLRTTFSDSKQGQLVRKINYANIDKYLYSNMPLVYQVANKLQSTAYLVNTDALKVINAVTNDEIFTFKEEQQKLIAKGFPLQIVLDKVRGMRREKSMVLHKANEIGDRTFWTYFYLDFRGRKYYSTHWMNPQGSKLAKSLFYFNESTEIGTAGLFFLKFQVANTWGEDKLSLDDRVSYVEDNLDWIMEIASDPVNDKRWQLADSPFEFLVAVMELKKALDCKDPTKFKSGLPIAMDATCSGLQWLAALSKDEVAGALCNLTDSDTIGDYYTYIADFVWNDSNLPDVWKAEYDDRRKIVKRSCMTIWYSAGKATMGNHVWADHGSTYPDVTEEDCKDLGELIYNTCLAKVKGPAEIMKLLMKLGEKEAKVGKDLELTLPVDEFPFIQTYRGNDKDRIYFYLNKKEIKLTYVSAYNTWIKTRDVITGSSPNFVHALDSQLVSKVVLDAEYPIIPIHDSFSTKPSDASKLYEDLRTAFVSIVEGDLLMDMFGQVHRESLLSTLVVGNLDTKAILDNEYTFS